MSESITKLSDIPDSTAHIDGSLWDKLRVSILIKLEGSKFDGNLLCFIIVEIFGLQIVVIIGVQYECIFRLVFNCSAILALCTHWII